MLASRRSKETDPPRRQAGEGSKERYRNVDAVYRHPTSGARLFVGNQTAARSESVLVGEGLFHVVNCQDESSANFFEHDARFSYKRFPVSRWYRAEGMDTADGVLASRSPRGHVSDASRRRRGWESPMHRGDAAAGTWTSRGNNFAATPRLGDVDIPR